MSINNKHSGLPQGMTRWELIKYIEQARITLKLSKGTVSYLKFALEKSFDDDFLPGRISAFWFSVTEIAAYIFLDRRQVSRIEAELVNKGLINKTCADHTRRHGERKNNIIINEYGINLKPLVQMASNIKSIAFNNISNLKEAKKLRLLITSLFGKIRRLDNKEVFSEAETILPNHRPSTITNLEKLKMIAEKLKTILSKFSEKLKKDKMSHSSDIYTIPFIHKKNNYKKNSTITKINNSDIIHEVERNPGIILDIASEKLKGYMEVYWGASKGRHSFSWSFIIEVIFSYSSSCELTQRLWNKACNQIGAVQAAICFVVVERNTERTDRYRVHKLAAAFHGMAMKHSRGDAILVKLLNELLNYVNQKHK